MRAPRPPSQETQIAASAPGHGAGELPRLLLITKPPGHWAIRLLKVAVFFALTAVTAGALAVLIAYIKYSAGLPEIPRVEEYRPPIVSEAFTSDAVLAGEFYNERRKVVPYERIPKRLVQAFIASEDASFFDHAGVDVLGTARAAFKTLLKKARGAGSVQGGSTLTQQTAKAVLVSAEMKRLDVEEMNREAERRVPQVPEPTDEQIAADVEAARKASGDKLIASDAKVKAQMLAEMRADVIAQLKSKAEMARRQAVKEQFIRVREEQTRAAFKDATTKKLTRKIREAILARRLESALTKEDILYLYLNNVYLGHHSYGVQATAENYYRKDVKDLTLGEMALIAGLPQAPSKYSPFTSPEAAKNRRRYVLGRMLKEGMITQAEHDQADAEEIHVYAVEDVFHEFAPYFTEEVRRWVVNRYGNTAMLNEGLKIFTTMDSERQRAAQDSVLNNLLVADKRQGFRGPVLQLGTEKERSAFIEKSKKAMGDEKLTLGRFYVGLVTSIDKEDKLAEVNVGGQIAQLPMLGMRWARKLNAEQYYPAVMINKISQALKVGDVVVVRPVEKKELTDDKEQHNDALAAAVPETGTLVRLEQEPELQSAIVSIDPHRQYLVAMVGGYDFDANEYNRAFQACRQPGSGFKPIVYSAAVEKMEWTEATTIVDSPIVEHDPEHQSTWKPENYSEEFVGDVLLRTALVNSMNIPAVKTFIAVSRKLGDGNERTGITKFADYVRSLGISNHVDTDGDRVPDSPINPDYSAALGSSCLYPLELAQVYATLNRLGVKKPTYFVRRVEDRFGRLLEDHTAYDDPWASLQDRVAAGYARLYEPGEAVMAPETAFIITDLMRGVVREGTGAAAQRLGKPAAGKTGTTNDSFDAWFTGFTRDLVTTAWVGYDQNKHPLGRYETGGRAALPIWLGYMKRALDGREQPEFYPPASLELLKLRIDNKTGKLASSGSKSSADMWFKKGTEPEDAQPEKGHVDPNQFMLQAP